MQIPPVIMRLLVILSVSLSVVRVSEAVLNYSNAVTREPFNGDTVATVVRGQNAGENGASTRLVLRRPVGSAVRASGNGTGLSRQRSLQDASRLVAAQSISNGQAVDPPASIPAKNVYRTRLSKLKIILLADVMGDVPPPLELITCLANSSNLNITTKHCDCESYSCKDLLTSSSSSSPFNSVHQRKIHTSCRDVCCRKKKFNRSIEPTIQNAVAAAVYRHNSIAPVLAQTGEVDPPRLAGVMSSDRPSLPQVVTTPIISADLPSRTHPLARGRPHRNCDGRTVNQTAIPSDSALNRGKGPELEGSSASMSAPADQLPWLYRVVLIEKALTICAGTLIHPNVLLTTAVCVINKNPDELIARCQSTKTSRNATSSGAGGSEELSRTIRRILLPNQFARTFERLENNVALLVLQQDDIVKQQQLAGVDAPPMSLVLKQAFPGTWYRSLRPSTAEAKPSASVQSGSKSAQEMALERLPNSYLTSASAEDKRNSHEPAYICLSSIINHPPASSKICRIYSWRKLRKSAAFGTIGQNRSDASRRQRRNQRPRSRLYPASARQHQQRRLDSIRSDYGDGTNYITANISIFPAIGSQCQWEHREYLQHQGNLCAGPEDKSQSLDVDLSGSPLICTEAFGKGQIRVEVRGILTWSTDINHAPHLFTNLTTYRNWIEDELDKLDQQRFW
ncbi:uncharacterized protein LOC129724692 [Wyeomyia smithii]|uniref:uncharacterized protein LOC129724692 n=1 Tax=Wyeomyia smithii TaxID=174621 RepID=UPI002467E420|nr:uncharacterized protein LOC129724692 [Wyeomyia smithii]XP_055535773.1 uncharacterized protein LOC129724692 [Wyeomyia smithii]XP_055535774.1 uncharacterized protein LOC129724692 [Wyeomyia smithii]XP_055535775.1 uncharacterized protein LOC129724692 [Wyeomyia smithii]XP_055535776.1 uncharacterized protein LOC129724692 [Wyeomyia smithii]XP_055535778.1 uncharacterized protein LOC129724692 [Wyeomyia smithii]